MGSSRTLVAPGLRTLPHAGWRSSVATALAVVLSNPSLWLLGALGFAARGGILLLTLVIVILPTPVEVRLLLGDYLASSGFTAAFFGLVLAMGVVGVLVIAAAMLLAARVDVAAFERFVGDPESGHEDGRDRAGGAPRKGAGGLVGRLLLVQLGALAMIALGAVPLSLSLYEATLHELLRPTPGGGVLYLRVLSAVREPLFLLLVAIVLVDLFSAWTSRRLMARHFGMDAASAGGRSIVRTLLALMAGPLRRPVSALATTALAWVATAAVLVPAAWALNMAWASTRAAYLGQGMNPAPQAMAWLVVVTVVFAAIWAATVLLAGFVSAFRANLWSAEALRR